MQIRRLGHPGHFARDVRARSGAWLKSFLPIKQGQGLREPAPEATKCQPAAERERKPRPVSPTEDNRDIVAQLAGRLAEVESQLLALQTGVETNGNEDMRPDPAEVWDGLLEEEGLRVPSQEQLRMPPLPEDLSGFPERRSSPVTAAPSARGVAGPVVHGSVAGVGLGTLFNLLENERLAGLLSLQSERQRLEFLFREGGIVRCECNSIRIAASEGVRIACTWNAAEFNFRRELPDEEVDAPRSANVLLLDVLRRQDERAAVR